MGMSTNDVRGQCWPLLASMDRALNADADINGFEPVTFEGLAMNNQVWKSKFAQILTRGVDPEQCRLPSVLWASLMPRSKGEARCSMPIVATGICRDAILVSAIRQRQSGCYPSLAKSDAAGEWARTPKCKPDQTGKLDAS